MCMQVVCMHVEPSREDALQLVGLGQYEHCFGLEVRQKISRGLPVAEKTGCFCIAKFILLSIFLWLIIFSVYLSVFKTL